MKLILQVVLALAILNENGECQLLPWVLGNSLFPSPYTRYPIYSQQWDPMTPENLVGHLRGEVEGVDEGKRVRFPWQIPGACTLTGKCPCGYNCRDGDCYCDKTKVSCGLSWEAWENSPAGIVPGLKGNC